MTQQSFEQRLADALAAYADQAPIDIEPVTMARFVAARSRRIGPVWFGNLPAGRVLVVAIALFALLVTTLAGAFVTGSYLRENASDAIPAERAFVEPFTGLPPLGVEPSKPETGELVLTFTGRVSSYGLRFTKVYEDGRLITGVERPGTYDVIEQHLTPEGVDLMRSAVLTDTALDRDLDSLYRQHNPLSSGGGPGAVWAWLQAQVGEQRFQVGWSDPDLPARIVDPGSWLPAHAWLDQRSMPYVASRYAVCVGIPVAWGAAPDPRSAAEVFELLPEPSRSLIRSSAVASTPDAENPGCLYEVATADARVIAPTLDRTMADTGTILRWTTRGQPSGRGEVTVELLRVLPDGGSVCNCG